MGNGKDPDSNNVVINKDGQGDAGSNGQGPKGRKFEPESVNELFSLSSLEKKQEDPLDEPVELNVDEPYIPPTIEAHLDEPTQVEPEAPGRILLAKEPTEAPPPPAPVEQPFSPLEDSGSGKNVPLAKMETSQGEAAGTASQGEAAGAASQGDAADTAPQGEAAGTEPQGEAAGTEPQGDAEGEKHYVSQAVQDLAGMDEETLKESKAAKKPSKKKPEPEKGIRAHIWQLFLILNQFFLVLWVVGSIIRNRPYALISVALVILILLLSFQAFHFLKIQTKAALAFLGSSLALAITSLHNPDINLVFFVPLTIIWGLILLGLWIYCFISTCKTVTFQRKKTLIILSIFFAYTLLGLLAGLISFFSGSTTIKLDNLNNSPAVIGTVLPWLLKPSFFFAIILPLVSAVFFFRYQIKTLSSANTGTKHAAGVFLGLASIFLMIFGFMGLQGATENLPGVAASLKKLVPQGSIFWDESNVHPEDQPASQAAEETPPEEAPPVTVITPEQPEKTPPATPPQTSDTSPAATPSP
ncbi:MAG: hypothetical protein LBE38_10810, partial [Deltaproteobacteria bacterium]|nr:hypothetical protein [Deltaproteobacteria bacterium]